MNKVILLGRLTKDVELRYTQHSNTAVASFALAVDRKFTKAGEEKQTDFFNIVAWNKLAETASEHLKKGMRVGIIGKLQNRSWDDEQGNKHYITEIIVEELNFIDPKKTQVNPSILDGSNQISPTNTEDTSMEFVGDDLPF